MNFHRLAVFLSFFVFLVSSACTQSTGTKAINSRLAQAKYTERSTVYVYRKTEFAGSIALMFIELNNVEVGVLGMGELVSATLSDGLNFLSVYSDMNQRSYDLRLELTSDQPRYVIASYQDQRLLKEVSFADWWAEVSPDVPPN